MLGVVDTSVTVVGAVVVVGTEVVVAVVVAVGEEVQIVLKIKFETKNLSNVNGYLWVQLFNTYLDTCGLGSDYL